MRAREAYSIFGPERLSDDQLLALVLGTASGPVTPLDMARQVLDRFGGLRGVAHAPVTALCQVPGIGPARAVRIHAGLAAGRRIAQPSPPTGHPIDSPHLAWAWLRGGLEDLPHEELHALYLDRALHPLALQRLSRGGKGGTVADPLLVFGPAMRCDASAVLLAHNHPSGDPTPSEQDRRLTRRLREVGHLLGTPLLDHLVLVPGAYVSILTTQEDGAEASPASIHFSQRERSRPTLAAPPRGWPHGARRE